MVNYYHIYFYFYLFMRIYVDYYEYRISFLIVISYVYIIYL